MKYGTLPQVKLPISRLVFGTATPKLFDATRSAHGDAPDFPERLDIAFRLLDDMYTLGVNCFDCADHYGEEPLGEWMESRGLRQKVVVLTKGAHPNRWRRRVTDFDILHDIHNSLCRLRTDFIDIYLLHRDDPDVPVGPIVDVLNRLRDEGRIGVFGGSNWTAERLEAANDYALRCGLQPFTVSSPNFGLAHQAEDPWGGGCVTLTGPENRAAREWYAREHMPVFAYSAMARGFFSGRVKSDDPKSAALHMDAAGLKGYAFPENFERLRRCETLARQRGLTVPQIAMAWLFNQPGLDVYAVTSPTHRDRMQASIEASAIPLTPKECRWLNLEE